MLDPDVGDRAAGRVTRLALNVSSAARSRSATGPCSLETRHGLAATRTRVALGVRWTCPVEQHISGITLRRSLALWPGGAQDRGSAQSDLAADVIGRTRASRLQWRFFRPATRRRRAAAPDACSATARVAAETGVGTCAARGQRTAAARPAAEAPPLPAPAGTAAIRQAGPAASRCEAFPPTASVLRRVAVRLPAAPEHDHDHERERERPERHARHLKQSIYQRHLPPASSDCERFAAKHRPSLRQCVPASRA